MSHAQFVKPLLAWFGRNARDLPWRRTVDPYGIWVSEVMLQQTQVKTVVPYWNRWMQVLPTVEALARARPDKIHKLWEGLGYYTRVRNLQKAARVIVEEHSGRFPREYEQVLQLPGIGRYTAGAICSIAFNQPRPILDGNVTRVLSRLFGIGGNPKDPKTNARLWHLAEALVQEASHISRHGTGEGHSLSANRRRFGSLASCSQFNQALMELGALVCTPQQPKCLQCPLASECVAHEQGRVAVLPKIGPRIRPTPRWFVAFAIEDRGQFLVRQRPAGVVNACMWEFPNLEVTPRKREPEQAFQKLLGIPAPNLKRLCAIKHTITRYRITLEVFAGSMRRPRARQSLEGRWLGPSKLRRLAFSSAHKKILAQVA